MANNLFCPLIANDCKENQCMFWMTHECIITSFLRLLLPRANEDPTKQEELADSESINQIAVGENFEEVCDEKELLRQVFCLPAEELAKQLADYAVKENLLAASDSYLSSDIEVLFWLSKGVKLSEYDLPTEYRVVKKKVEVLAQNILSDSKKIDLEDGESESNVRLDAEDEALADDYITFFKELNKNSSDIDYFDYESQMLFWKSKGLANIYDLDVPTSIKKKSVEKLVITKLANQVFSIPRDDLCKEFINEIKRYSDPDIRLHLSTDQYAQNFWGKKGLGSYQFIGTEIQRKKDEIEKETQKLLDKEYDDYINAMKEKEKSLLPGIITSCVEWAKEMNRKTLSVKDIRFFLMENKIELSTENERAIYLYANNELKKDEFRTLQRIFSSNDQSEQ